MDFGSSNTTEKVIHVSKSSSLASGGCSFCTRHIGPSGQANHTVYLVRGEQGMEARFCRLCYGELRTPR
jgi:hypothetical protein